MMAYKFTNDEERLVFVVLDELMKMGYKKLNTVFGTLTIEDIQVLHSKLHYNDYCERHGVKYEEMTDEDYIRAYEEEEEERYQRVKEAREAEEMGW